MASLVATSSPERPTEPLPDTVEMVPSVATLRMVALPVSAIRADPSDRRSHVLWAGDAGDVGVPGVTVVAFIAVAGEDADDAVGIDHADGVVRGGDDIDLARLIDGDGDGRMDLGIGGGAAVAPETGLREAAIPREGADDAVGVHHADAVIQRIRNVEVAGGIERHALRRVEPVRWPRDRRRPKNRRASCPRSA